ncbi:hypothetical protein PIB30_043887 [Stylosanthes scabra]|uniref:beta-aspartyl-peptidase n=1 Tax=Stylosanthes scabra TaxID=79078 RepID=A0ABU6SFK0_9FABA|nr:hypothetical protein [Stylosanthes scabra]
MGWAIALHGGGGDIPLSLPPESRQPREEALRHCLQIGVEALKAKKPSLDVVELVVHELENIPQFNAGKGSVLTNKGTVEMEASIMDGSTKNCGAVSGLKTVINAVSLARLVMEKTPHVYLAFHGAEEFAKEQGVETADPSHFITAENVERLKQAKEAHRVQLDYTQPLQNGSKEATPNANGDVQLGTVGCVAVNSYGNLAAATSTGGLVNKRVGRIGDSPIIGAGTYANELCAVSSTGKGEAILRATVARDVAAMMEFKGVPLEKAASYVIHECMPKGTPVWLLCLPLEKLQCLRTQSACFGHVLLKMVIQRLQFGLHPKWWE